MPTNKPAEELTENTDLETDPKHISHTLSEFQQDCLVVIRDMGDPDGQTIGKTLADSRREVVTHGRLYSNLDTLVEKGLVTVGEKDLRTNEYQITDRGRAVLDKRLAWFDGGVDVDEEDRSR